MGRLMTMVLLGAVLASTVSASAQDESGSTGERSPDEREAQMRFELGRRYYETGRFLEAAEEFESAIEIAPLPALFFNLYLAYRDAGEDERAVAPLRTYIGTLQAGDRRTQLEVRLRILEGQEEPEAREQRVAQSSSVGVQMTAEAANNADDGVDPGPWVLVGSGGLLVAGAVVTGLLSMGDRSSLDELCVTPERCPDGFEDTQSRGEMLSILTDVLWMSGAAAVAAGVVWAIVDATADESTPRAGLACDEHGCLATLRGEL